MLLTEIQLDITATNWKIQLYSYAASEIIAFIQTRASAYSWGRRKRNNTLFHLSCRKMMRLICICRSYSIFDFIDLIYPCYIGDQSLTDYTPYIYLVSINQWLCYPCVWIVIVYMRAFASSLYIIELVSHGL